MTIPPATLRRRLLLLAAAASLTTAAWASPASAAAPAVPSCGAVLTQDTTLAADLVDCPGDGLVIGADGITVDLAGHLVDGVGAGIGIRNPGHDRVRILQGSVREFGIGVAFSGVDASTVERMILGANRVYGLQLAGSDGNRVANSDVVGNRAGVQILAGSDGNTLATIRVAGNRNPALPAAGHGIALGGVGRGGTLGDNRNAILGSTVTANSGHGILIGASSDHGSRVEGNRTHRNGASGIAVYCGSFCTPTSLRENVAERNGAWGIQADPGSVAAAGNRARANGAAAQCLNVGCGA